MSSVFRAILINRGVQWCTLNPKIFFKYNPNLSGVSNVNSKSKALVALASSYRREYSTDNPKIKSTAIKQEEKEIVYSGLLTKQIRNLKYFSITTSVCGLALQPYVYSRLLQAGTVGILMPISALIGVFALLTPLFIHIITKKYVLCVEYVPKDDKYIATTFNMFGMKKQVEFTPDDVTIPTVLGMFTSCAIKGKAAYLDAEHFTDQNHYIRIMGYDKPVDLEVKVAEDDSDETCIKRKDKT